MCYYMQPPPLKTSHLSKFQLETLFYIFYAMPRDVLQVRLARAPRRTRASNALFVASSSDNPLPSRAIAAFQAYVQELYAREWQYHRELKLWFRRATAADLAGAPGVAPGQSAYVFFDITAWECRLFTNHARAATLAAGLVSEEDVRVQSFGHAAPPQTGAPPPKQS